MKINTKIYDEILAQIKLPSPSPSQYQKCSSKTLAWKIKKELVRGRAMALFLQFESETFSAGSWFECLFPVGFASHLYLGEVLENLGSEA